MTKQRRRPIMVAIRELDRSSSRLLRKAATLAKAYNGELELVHVIALPYVPAAGLRASVRDAAHEIVANRKQRLLKLAESASLRGIRTSTTVLWERSAAAGLVRHVSKRRPQLLLAESHRRSPLIRAFLTNTDWELIRNCPCPLWLSKAVRWRPNGRVLAALDPSHAHAKPAALESRILRHALSAAGGRSARLLACHAYTLPAPPKIDGTVEAYWIGMSDRQLDRHKMKLVRQLRRLTDAYEIPAKNTLLVAGDPASVLPRVAKKHRASVVVMGAVSRSALMRVFIGHTAEHVIDALDCDVLIVKPRGFKTSVKERPRRTSVASSSGVLGASLP